MVATPNLCYFYALHLPYLCTAPTHRSCSISLSVPQDSAFGVAKFFKEAKLNPTQISQADTSSVASITMAWLIPNLEVPEVMLSNAPGDRNGADGPLYLEPSGVSSLTTSIPSLVLEMQVS